MMRMSEPTADQLKIKNLKILLSQALRFVEAKNLEDEKERPLDLWSAAWNAAWSNYEFDTRRFNIQLEQAINIQLEQAIKEALTN
jgi:hypothetical protein